MDYRCSSSVAGLALLIGGSCALLTPGASAGDRIEFSAPAIPLAIPLPVVENKESQKPFISADAPTDGMDDAYMVPPQQFSVSKARSRDKDPWDADPAQSDDLDPFQLDDLFSARREPDKTTNGSSLHVQRGWDAGAPDRMLLRREDSGAEDGQDASKFGAQNGVDKENGREGSLFTGDNANEKKDSFLFRMFNRDPAESERSRAADFTSFMGESRNLTGIDSTEHDNKLGLPVDSARDSALPPGYGSYIPLDNRQTDEQAGATPGYMRAWEPPPARSMASKSYSNPDQPNPSRVVAPSRPANLPWAKRLGDPNPF